MLLVGNAVSNPETIKTVKFFFDVTIITPEKLGIFLKKQGNIDVLWIHFDTYLDESYIDLLMRVRFIISTTTGTTHICKQIQQKFGDNLLTLKRQKFLKTISSVAELTWSFVMYSNINIQEAIDSVSKCEWDRQSHLRATQLRSKKLGIVGYGRLGKMVARMAKGFSMDVIVHDKKITTNLFAKFKGFKVATSLEKLVHQCDILSIHADYVLGQEPILNSKILSGIKQPLVIINTARAGLVDEFEILELMKSGKDLRYFSDVLDFEEKNSRLIDSKLWRHSLNTKKIVITPHMGGANLEAIYLCEKNLLTRILNKYSF